MRCNGNCDMDPIGIAGELLSIVALSVFMELSIVESQTKFDANRLVQKLEDIFWKASEAAKVLLSANILLARKQIATRKLSKKTTILALHVIQSIREIVAMFHGCSEHLCILANESEWLAASAEKTAKSNRVSYAQGEVSGISSLPSNDYLGRLAEHADTLERCVGDHPKAI